IQHLARKLHLDPSIARKGSLSAVRHIESNDEAINLLNEVFDRKDLSKIFSQDEFNSLVESVLSSKKISNETKLLWKLEQRNFNLSEPNIKKLFHIMKESRFSENLLQLLESNPDNA